MRKILSALVILLVTAASYSQVQLAWGANFNFSDNSSDYPNAVVVDAAGNIYVVGATERGATVEDNDDGIITIKYNKAGQKIWSARYQRVNLKGTGIAIDAAGNVYVVGRQDWDTSPEAFRFDFVTLKYNSLGALIWSREYRESGSSSYSAYLGFDAAGNIYTSGTSVGEDDEEGASTKDFATLKYDNNGDPKWLRRYNGAAPAQFDDAVEGIVVDAAGNVYITGTSQKDGRISCTTIKYGTDGTEQWVKRYNSTATSTDDGVAIALDAAGNVYVISFTNGRDFTTIKYSPDGVQQWAKLYGSPSGFIDIPGSIGTDNAGNIYVTGISNTGFAALPNYDLVTIKYNTNGDELWVRNYALNTNHFGLALDDQGSDHFANLFVGADNNVYISTTLRSADESYNFLTLRYNPNGDLKWALPYNSGASIPEWARGLTVDGLGSVYVIGEVSVGPFSRTTFGLVKYTQCEINCPSNITVNNDPDKCDAIVNFNPATYTGDCGSSFTYSHNTGIAFPIGTTTVTVTSDATGASCSFTVTVNDNQTPVITCPGNKNVNMNTGVCYATVDPGLATATDNCSATVVRVRSDGLALDANYPGGTTIITWTATDPSNNSSTCSQTITVVDNEPPVISGESASTYVLSPPNHTMRDVTINYTATDNCAVTSVITVTSNEPINGVGDGDTDPDWVVTDNHHVKLRAERSANGTGRIYTITITATDPAGNTAVKTVEVRVPHNIKNPHSGQSFKVGSTVSFEGEFWDKPGNKHTAKWLIDDNTTAKAIVTEPAGNKNGKVTGSYKFTAPGVYKLQMNVTDQNGKTHYTNTAGDLEAIVVIYDPNGGFAYGGGYYNSPAGALRSDPAATGKASYGFTMNYFKNSTYPKGETQFDFKVGSFEFNALNFEYLVISNSMAQFKGTGKIIGGQSGVGFTMTVTDGQFDGTGVDKIRMKIYNRSNGTIIYDNQPGASDAALPTQAVGVNSIVVISGTNSSLTSSNTSQKAEMEASAEKIPNGLDLIAYPNPSAGNFILNVNAKTNERITMQVIDMYGRVIETRNESANSNIRFGDRYRPGTYFVRIIQGKEYKEIKLIKLSD